MFCFSIYTFDQATPGGPAMTWGMFAIGHLELNDTLEAGRLFKKQTGNVAAPYNVNKIVQYLCKL